MYSINQAAVSYTDPWKITLDQRINALMRGKRRVAYFYEAANNSTFRYRAYNMAQVLNEGDFDEISASYFFLSDMHQMEYIAKCADVLVICRSGYNHIINQLITKFKLQNKKVLFDIDDLVFNTNYVHQIVDTLGQDKERVEVWDYWFSYVSRMGETMKMCDAAITTNSYLADRINEYSGLPTYIIPNFINNEQMAISSSLYADKLKSNFARNDKISLGYFSGSPSHRLDYALITESLAEVLESDNRVEVVMVGYVELDINMRNFKDRVKYYPFHDYVNLQRLIGSVEFNLMPLQANIFTNCKSELKYFEAAIVGTLSIASPSYTYQSSIQHKKNGYLAKAHEWSSVIQEAIINMDNYSEMAINAHIDVKSKYTGKNLREIILKAVG